MLKIDFYESGVGETIILTFPDGGLGIVDAHPSRGSLRPDIRQLIGSQTVHFVCLTHPHRDHGLDLVSVLETNTNVKEFWHTVDDVSVTLFLQQEVTNYPNYPSECREAVVRMKRKWADFLVDIYGAVVENNITIKHIRDDIRPITICDVEIYVLSPSQSVNQRFTQKYGKRLSGEDAELPNPNLLSAILAVKYGECVILLGGDALKENWASASRLFRELDLPKAQILKVPHHGSADALLTTKKRHQKNYIDLCSDISNNSHSVLFAGDTRHPSPKVFKNLIARTKTVCVSNGLKNARPYNPLTLSIPGAKAVALPPVCNPVVSFEISHSGDIVRKKGDCHDECHAIKYANSN